MCYRISEEWDFTHLRSSGFSSILPLPTPSVAGEHRLVSLFAKGPLMLRVGHEIGLCHRPLRLPLSGQRPVTSGTGRGGDAAPRRGHE